MTPNDLRAQYIAFFFVRGHVELPSAPLVPENDPTTLFTSSGMQPLVPYLLGQPHPEGKRLVNSQKVSDQVILKKLGITDTPHFLRCLETGRSATTLNKNNFNGALSF